jgi:hypothetical protein
MKRSDLLETPSGLTLNSHLESSMERAVFQKIATPVDRLEYRTWARRVSALYGVLFLAGIGFAIAHHHQSTNAAAYAGSALTGSAVVAINQSRR